MYCKVASTFHGLTINDVRHLAFQLALRNKIKHAFNKDTVYDGKLHC